MKTKQTKIDRSAAKWLPGAMALAATTASSQAATVQITLTGNKISSSGGNELAADMTGDEIDDLEFGSTFYRTFGVFVVINGGNPVGAGQGSSLYRLAAGIVETGVIALDYVGGSFPSPATATVLNPITFQDARINGGAVSEGWLEVHAFNTNATNHTVELSRLIFDDTSTTRPALTEIPGVQTEWGVSAVPEPATNLGLLALGAGGLLTRRRLKRAA